MFDLEKIVTKNFVNLLGLMYILSGFMLVLTGMSTIAGLLFIVMAVTAMRITAILNRGK